MNEGTAAIVKEAKKNSKKKMKNIKDIKFFNSFIIGQNSLYVFEDYNKAKINDKIINNGPEWHYHIWSQQKGA